MRYDMYYIKYHSVRLDVEIIVRTMAVIVLGSESPRMGSIPKDDSRFSQQAAAVGSIPEEHSRLDERPAA
jgi:hypothetical protein